MHRLMPCLPSRCFAPLVLVPFLVLFPVLFLVLVLFLFLFLFLFHVLVLVLVLLVPSTFLFLSRSRALPTSRALSLSHASSTCPHGTTTYITIFNLISLSLLNKVGGTGRTASHFVGAADRKQSGRLEEEEYIHCPTATFTTCTGRRRRRRRRSPPK